jgi:hypothetical protein
VFDDGLGHAVPYWPYGTLMPYGTLLALRYPTGHTIPYCLTVPYWPYGTLLAIRYPNALRYPTGHTVPYCLTLPYCLTVCHCYVIQHLGFMLQQPPKAAAVRSQIILVTFQNTSMKVSHYMCCSITELSLLNS